MSPEALSALKAREVCDHLFVHAHAVERAAFAFSEGGTIPQWKEELDAYGRRGQLYPDSILLEGVPFGLGTDYDEACSGMGVSSLYGLERPFAIDAPLRDLVVLLIDAPPALERLVYEAGAFTALCREGAAETARQFNWEACITLSSAYPKERLVDALALDTGGADIVVGYGNAPFDEDMQVMARTLGTKLVHVGGMQESDTLHIASAPERDVMRYIVELRRNNK